VWAKVVKLNLAHNLLTFGDILMNWYFGMIGGMIIAPLVLIGVMVWIEKKRR
jgi:hypothetical protein